MTAKSDADLLREILVFIHIPAQQAALERAIKMVEDQDKLTATINKVRKAMDAERDPTYVCAAR